MILLLEHMTLAHLLGTEAVQPTPARPEEAITISRRPWFAVCGGLCPDYDITVWSDGRVLVKQRKSELSFNVDRSEAATFANKLQPFRPSNEQSGSPVCAHDVQPGDEKMVMEVKEVEIRWSGPDAPARILACDNALYASLLDAIRQALWSVHLQLDGQRRD